jgi:hypothetical protein
MTTNLLTNLGPLIIPPPANNVAEAGYQWIQGFTEVVKILAVFGGALTGGYFSHRLLLCRDVSSRKKAFLGFLRKWKSEISPVSSENLGIALKPAVSVAEKVYDANVGYFWERVESVRCDYSDADRFEALTSRLGSLRPADLHGDKQPCDVILKAIDDLIEFSSKP